MLQQGTYQDKFISWGSDGGMSAVFRDGLSQSVTPRRVFDLQMLQIEMNGRTSQKDLNL